MSSRMLFVILSRSEGSRSPAREILHFVQNDKRALRMTWCADLSLLARSFDATPSWICHYITIDTVYDALTFTSSTKKEDDTQLEEVVAPKTSVTV